MSNAIITEVMYVTKQLAGAEDITRGFGLEFQPRAKNNQTPVRQVNASHFQGVLVFGTLKEMNETDVSYMGEKKCAINNETGQIYFYEKGQWTPSEEQIFKIANVGEFSKVPAGVTTCIVTDPVRGGEFRYADTKKDINDGGVIFNGWVRQFSGYANVKWFGAIGNGIEDDTLAIQRAINAKYPLFIPAGQYIVTNTLQCKESTEIEGIAGSVFKTTDEIAILKLASYTIVKGIEFVGRADAQNQVGVLVDGGASLRDVFKTRVIECKFTNFGGKCYELINSIGDGHLLSNSFMSISKIGVEVGLQGNGLNISGCLIESCGKGLISSGGSITCSGNMILNNQQGLVFIAGASGVDSKTIIDGCVISDSASQDVYIESITNKGFIVSSSSIFGKIVINSSEGINFLSCNLKSAQISFNQSNNNIFDGCITENIQVTNDVNGIPTRNYFINNITNTDYAPDSAGELDGGYVKASSDVDYLITNNKASVVSFPSVTQSLPYHSAYSKDKLFDPTTNTFDFTRVVTPSSKNMIKANIQLTLDDTTNIAHQENIAVYLYRVDSAGEDVNTTIDLSKITAILSNTGVALQNNGCVYTFSGEVPRAMYKVVVKCNTVAGKKFVKQGTQIHTSLQNAPFKAEFWGI